MLRAPPRVDFPAIIRRIELSRGITQSELAKRLHVAPSSVHRWAVGYAKPNYSHGRALVFLAAGDHADDNTEPDASTSPSDAR